MLDSAFSKHLFLKGGLKITSESLTRWTDVHEGVVGLREKQHRTFWKLLTVPGCNHAAMQSRQLPKTHQQLTLVLTPTHADSNIINFKLQ